MKKLLTLLVLLVAIVTGAKADTNETISWSGSSLTGTSGTNVTAGTAAPVNGTTYKAGTLSISSSKIQTESKKHQTDSYWEDFSSGAQGATSTNATSTARAEFPITIADGYAFNVTEVDFKLEQGGGGGPAVHVFLVQEETSTWLGFTAAGTIAYDKLDINLSSGSAKLVFVLGLTGNLNNGRQFKFSNIAIKGTTATSGPVDPEFTLSANEVEVGKTISVNGPEGLEFTATPVGETTGEVSVSGGTITGVTAGAAQVQVTSSATDKYNAYDHTFDITVIAAKIATELSFGAPTTTVARGEEVTNAATLTAGGSPIEGTITYSSADETIATVDATGKVTGIKTGTTSIKANYAGDATYSAAEEVSYDITVTLPALTPVSDTKWTSASLMTAAGGAKDYTSADVLDNLEIVGTSTALKITTGGNKTIDGETFGGRVRFGKDGSADGNYVHFKVTPNSSITIWGIRATSGAEADGLAISVGAFGENEKVYSFVGGDVESMTYLYTGDADADVYAYSKNTNGASMMEIKVAPIQYETITTDNNVTTYVTQNALDFTDLETKAYVVTGISNEKTYVTTEEVTIVPAGTALLVKGATVDVPIIGDAAAPATNLLQISTGEGVQGADDIFAYSKTEQKFKKVDSSIKVPVGKCYLVIEGVTGSSLDIDFNGATAVETIAEANDKANTVAPVKVIKGGQLFIGNYNVAGQQVK